MQPHIHLVVKIRRTALPSVPCGSPPALGCHSGIVGIARANEHCRCAAPSDRPCEGRRGSHAGSLLWLEATPPVQCGHVKKPNQSTLWLRRRRSPRGPTALGPAERHCCAHESAVRSLFADCDECVNAATAVEYSASVNASALRMRRQSRAQSASESACAPPRLGARRAHRSRHMLRMCCSSKGCAPSPPHIPRGVRAMRHSHRQAAFPLPHQSGHTCVCSAP